MQNILKILKTDGIFITESHYLVSLIKDLQYDTIYHEHLRYYSLSSLKYLLEKYNLSIFHAKKIPTHGGSIRVYAARKGKFKTLNSVKKILDEEKKFLNWKNFNKFRSDVVKSKLNLYKILNNIVKSKQKIYVIGAPSRASTLINYLGLTNEVLQYVCEVDGSYKIVIICQGRIFP